MNYAQYAKKLTSPKPAREVFVAFLDILGFSNFVRQNSHEDVVAIYQTFFRPSIDFSLAEVAEQRIDDSLWLKSITDSENYEDLAPKLDNVILNCMTISDSIVLTTSGAELRDLLTLIATVRNFMAKSLYFGFPLRGAIAEGMLTLDCDTYSSTSNVIHHQMLGLSVVEAVSLEKRQNWSGCALHSSVAHKLGPRIMRLEPTMIAFYDVPMKGKVNKAGDNLSALMPVVNWAHGIADNDKPKINAELIKSSFGRHGKKVSSDIEPMINNTVMFFEEMSKHPVYKNEMSNDEWWALVEQELNESAF